MSIILHKSTTLRGMCIYFFLINSYIFELSLFCSFLFTKEEFEDTKGVIRIRISQEEQTTQWLKEKVQKDKQRFTKHTHKTKDRVTRTPLKSRK